MDNLAVVFNQGAARRHTELIQAASSVASQVCVSLDEEMAADFYRRALFSGIRRFIVGGGDGTLAHALTTLWRSNDGDLDGIRVGLVRLGTGNAVADAFSIGKASGPAVIELAAALSGEESGETLRTLAVDDRLGCFAGFGVDAEFVADHERTVSWLRRRRLEWIGRGRVGYGVSILSRSLPRFVRGQRPFVTAINGGSEARACERDQPGPASVESGAVLWRGRCTLAACSTIPTFGFGLRMFPLADADPARFQLRTSDAGLGEIIGKTRAAFRGTYYSENVVDHLCDAVLLESTVAAPFELSGDVIGHLRAARIEIGPQFELFGSP